MFIENERFDGEIPFDEFKDDIDDYSADDNFDDDDENDEIIDYML